MKRIRTGQSDEVGMTDTFFARYGLAVINVFFHIGWLFHCPAVLFTAKFK